MLAPAIAYLGFLISYQHFLYIISLTGGRQEVLHIFISKASPARCGNINAGEDTWIKITD